MLLKRACGVKELLHHLSPPFYLHKTTLQALLSNMEVYSYGGISMGRRPKMAGLPHALPPLVPAMTPNGRENQMISLAFDLVEQRLRDGTASSQETTHFLKLGTEQAKLEQKRMQAEIELAEAKRQSLQFQEKMEKMVLNVLISVMKILLLFMMSILI